jgi:glutamine synthetase
MTDPAALLEENGIRRVEVLVPDTNGVPRGKVLPADKFLKSLEDQALYLPSSAFLVSIEGRYTGAVDIDFAYQDPDTRLVPDLSTLCLMPGVDEPTACVFADAFGLDGQPWMAAPRQVLRTVLDLYRGKGWKPVVAPELEFYLVAPNPDPDLSLMAPLGRSGRNLLHGDPLRLADQVVLFKRIARQAADANGCHATFMAKPLADHAGSSMHLHISVVDEAGENVFADGDGTDTPLFAQFIGGLQKYIPEIMPLMAPNVNSFRRIRPSHSAPANVEWSHDNRSCGLRVPAGGRSARRIENRLPGADANPYLAIAASLIAGYLGVEERIERSGEARGNAYRQPSALPRTMEEALARFAACAPVRELLGEAFFQTYLRVKSVELDVFQNIVTSWERDHLLLKV